MSSNLYKPVLREWCRKDTNVSDGFIELDAARNRYCLDRQFRFVSDQSLYLGNERPVYEISFQQGIYRMLFRPIGANVGKAGIDDYEFIRCYASGLKSDGVLLSPPLKVPNTPIALFQEICELTKGDEKVILHEAFDICRYRAENHAAYPETFTPTGYSLRSSLLLYLDDNGTVRSLYDTPRAVRDDAWSLFLHALSRSRSQPGKLIDYVFSQIAARELGSAGRDAALEVIKMRFEGPLNPKFSQRSIVDLLTGVGHAGAKGRTIGIDSFCTEF